MRLPTMFLCALACAVGFALCAASATIADQTTSPPTIQFMDAPAPSTNTTVTVSFQTTNATSVSCTLDGTPVDCQSYSVTLSVGVGPHTFTVTVDGPGGETQRSLPWTTYAPVVVTITSASTNLTWQTTTATVTYTTQNATSVTCTLDGEPVACAGGTITASGLGTGGHTVWVTAVGPGGQQSASALWVIPEPPPPRLHQTSPPPRTKAATSETFIYTTQNATGVICTLDLEPIACSASSLTVRGLSIGMHLVTISAIGYNGCACANGGTIWGVTPRKGGLRAETKLRKNTLSVIAAALSAANLRAPNGADYDQAIAVAGAGGRCAQADAPDTPMNLFGDCVYGLRAASTAANRLYLVQRRSDGYVMASVIRPRRITTVGFWPRPFVPLYPEVLAHLH